MFYVRYYYVCFNITFLQEDEEDKEKKGWSCECVCVCVLRTKKEG